MISVAARPQTTARWSGRRALRSGLILGGFIAVWWAMMAGTAHAEDSSPLTGTVTGTVDSVVQKASDPPAQGGDRLRDQVRHQAKTPVRAAVTTSITRATQPRPAKPAATGGPTKATPVLNVTPKPRPVRSVVARTTKAANGVHAETKKAVSQVLDSAHRVVEATPVAPVIAAVEADLAKASDAPALDLVGATLGLPIPSTAHLLSTAPQSGRSMGQRGHEQDTDRLRPFAVHGSAGTTSSYADAVSSDADRAETETAAAEAPAPAPLPAPAQPGPSAPATSGPAPTSTTNVIVEPWLLAAPQFTQDPTAGALAIRHSAPAYLPGSSPD